MRRRHVTVAMTQSSTFLLGASFLVAFLTCIQPGQALKCYVCGPSQTSDVCTAEFEHECPQGGGDERSFCVTTLQMLEVGKYSTTKECASSAKLQTGCKHIDNSQSRCVCDTDLCNDVSLTDHWFRETPLKDQPIDSVSSTGSSFKQEIRSTVPSDVPDPLQGNYVYDYDGQGGFDYYQDSPRGVIPQFIPVSDPGLPRHVPNPTHQPGIVTHPGSSYPPPENAITFLHPNGQPPTQSSAYQRLDCVSCAESGLPNDQSDCTSPQAVACDIMEGQPRCFTKISRISSGSFFVEKECVSSQQLSVIYGTQSGQVTDGCFQTVDGATQLCVCTTSHCNWESIGEQLKVMPPVVLPPHSASQALALDALQPLVPRAPTTPAAEPTESLKCMSCLSPDLNEPVECATQVPHVCSESYDPLQEEILCLTRMLKTINGKFTMEKRCISASEHNESYPGERVVSNGCGDAWNGYVQYCVCKDHDSCNAAALWDQQIAEGIEPFIPSDDPISPGTPLSTNAPQHDIEGIETEPDWVHKAKDNESINRVKFWQNYNAGTYSAYSEYVFLLTLSMHFFHIAQ